MDRVAIRPVIASIIVAASMAGAWAFPAAAQSIEDEATQAATLPEPAETREERLSRLFAALAATRDEKEADRIAGEIRDIWAKSGSDSMDFLLERARRATAEKRYDRARAHVAALNRLAPDFAEGWNAAATLAYLQEDLGRAAADIERALALEPRHFSAISGLAMILEKVERKRAALAAWREVERLYPTLDRAKEAVERLSPEADGRAL
ncbi:MAG: hypothetical protein WD969_01625 [Paracoccaceae bacterium]